MDRQPIINYRSLSLIIGFLLIAGNLIAQPQQHEKRPPTLPDSAHIVQMVDMLATSRPKKTKTLIILSLLLNRRIDK